MLNATVNCQHEPEVGLPRTIDLELRVRDPETILELWRHNESESCNAFALSALRLGVLAIRQASGVLDVAMIRNEGERLVSSVREVLSERSTQLLGGITSSLRQYLDPTDGQLPQRIERLPKRDGELEGLLSRHLNGNDSMLARTLTSHVGEQSALVRMLSPKQSDGILKALTDVVTTALCQQREHVLGQFSLDNDESALSRLVKHVTDSNGKFRADLAEDLTKVCAEFSLDNEDGALARLVGQVEKAQRSIVEQFSLDNERSALSRMSKLLETTNATVKANLTLDDEKSPLACLRRELVQVLAQQNKAATEFQSEMRATLESFRTRRDEASRSTAHGGDFEDAVGHVLCQEAQRMGDVFNHVGNAVGTKPRCKMGDFVITLGADSAAPDANIVCEAKSDNSYTMARALAEIEEARDNRAAQVGIFIFSKNSAPNGMQPLARYGSDIVVLWDQEDPLTDVFLYGAISVAKALVVRSERASNKTAADFTEIESAVSRIANDAKLLAEISTHAGTVKATGQKILEKTDKVREDLEKQIETLLEHIGRLKTDVVATGDT